MSGEKREDDQQLKQQPPQPSHLDGDLLLKELPPFREDSSSLKIFIFHFFFYSHF